MRATPPDAPRGPRCPTCGKPVTWQGNPARPFCSVGCKLVDLGGWFDESYRVPGPPVALEEGTPGAPADRGHVGPGRDAPDAPRENAAESRHRGGD